MHSHRGFRQDATWHARLQSPGRSTAHRSALAPTAARLRCCLPPLRRPDQPRVRWPRPERPPTCHRHPDRAQSTQLPADRSPSTRRDASGGVLRPAKRLPIRAAHPRDAIAAKSPGDRAPAHLARSPDARPPVRFPASRPGRSASAGFWSRRHGREVRRAGPAPDRRARSRVVAGPHRGRRAPVRYARAGPSSGDPAHRERWRVPVRAGSNHQPLRGSLAIVASAAWTLSSSKFSRSPVACGTRTSSKRASRVTARLRPACGQAARTKTTQTKSGRLS